jgi:hypothetical protein
MAKLSDIFSRKSASASVEKLTPRSRNGNGSASDHISFDSPSDIGSRIGEENEILRTLLTDTGRKISELDELKSAFDKLVHAARARAGKITDDEPLRDAFGGSQLLRHPAHGILSGRTKGHGT